MSLKAFLLCAGAGTRFRPHTHIFPKVLLPFLNLPLVSYNLYLLKTLGVKNWAANTHLHPRVLEDKLKQQAGLVGINSPLVSHEQKLLGSAGGLLKLKNFFEKEKHFFYLNGDSFIWPEKQDSLTDFYLAHIESGALASFLVKPADKTQGVLWADDTDQIYSFLKKPAGRANIRAYDFSGLAIFSTRVFQEIKSPEVVHIFKDVLESSVLKTYLRIHSVPRLKLLDMNQLNTYLKNIKQVLYVLRDKNSAFLQETLNLCSPDWSRFHGENYFSVNKVKKPPENKTDILFCGREVKFLEKLFVKNFAVLGDHSSIMSPVCMEGSVLGERVALNKNLQNELVLNSDFFT